MPNNPASLPSVQPPTRPTILIVEDNDDLRTALRHTLMRMGYRVLDACDGVAAVLLSATYPEDIDLVLVDFDLPSSNGTTVVQRLRVRRPSLRHVYMSGHTDVWLADMGLTDLGGCLLRKPVSVH